MSRRQTTTQRRGFTLVEMVAIITLTATLTGTIIVSLAGLFRYNQAMNHRHDAEFALRQFTTALRRDVHRAQACQWDSEQQELKLSLPESGRASYRLEESHWRRTFADAQGEETTTGYGLDDSFRCECEQLQISGGKLLRLSLSNGPLDPEDDTTLEHRPLRWDLVAQVGRDLVGTEGEAP